MFLSLVCRLCGRPVFCGLVFRCFTAFAGGDLDIYYSLFAAFAGGQYLICGLVMIQVLFAAFAGGQFYVDYPSFFTAFAGGRLDFLKISSQ